ncbi:MAG: hypothetical protein LBJ00_09180 [Planctomycetaceae bacterium]|jgi:hypothetical protein|nr:hypothetical protein [Planctomycetaceae bacterium]
MKTKFELFRFVFGFGVFGGVGMSLYSSCFKIPEVGHTSVASRSGCSWVKPTASTGVGIAGLSVFDFVRRLLRVVLFFGVLTVVVIATNQASGEQSENEPKNEKVQDIWMITTETASWTKATDSEFEKIVYWHLVKNGERRSWEKSDAATFFSTQNPSVPILIFSPGYTSKKSDTVEIGLKILGLCDSRKPIRVIFWHWPSEKLDGCLLTDIRSKIPIAEANAVYMSMLLKRLKADSKVSVLGFSFGTRLLGDAVEGVGELKPEGMRINLIYGGAASDRDWLAEGKRNGNVPKIAHKILVLYNPEDFRLKFYPYLYKNGNDPVPLGRDGAPMRFIAPEFRNKIEMVNLAPHIGFRHKTVILIGTKQFRDRINEYFFFE